MNSLQLSLELTQQKSAEELKQSFLKIKNFNSRLVAMMELTPNSFEGCTSRNFQKDWLRSFKKNTLQPSDAPAPNKVKIRRECINHLAVLVGRSQRTIERGLTSFFKRSFNFDNVLPYSKDWFVFGVPKVPKKKRARRKPQSKITSIPNKSKNKKTNTNTKTRTRTKAKTNKSQNQNKKQNNNKKANTNKDQKKTKKTNTATVTQRIVEKKQNQQTNVNNRKRNREIPISLTTKPKTQTNSKPQPKPQKHQKQKEKKIVQETARSPLMVHSPVEENLRMNGSCDLFYPQFVPQQIFEFVHEQQEITLLKEPIVKQRRLLVTQQTQEQISKNLVFGFSCQQNWKEEFIPNNFFPGYIEDEEERWMSDLQSFSIFD
ncbi:mis18-binding protein [Anaeramoeba flamelloides]|uniref:Mis18-binding protein n=1 Tax=Anaeramoeba flamelloides TaxID=1746091 RepID=A0ABQ8Y3A2_9EUKA|nr:mis18-binding protein [Anaeramoeba flamelloides]